MSKPSLVTRLRYYQWLLADPKRWEHSAHFLLSRLGHDETRDAAERDEASAWCQSVAIPVEDAMDRLGLPRHEGTMLEMPEGVMHDAMERVSATKVRMGGAGALNFIYSCVKALRPENCIETGVAFGWSSLAILTALEENGSGRLVSIDMPYPLRGKERFVGTAVPSDLHDRWTLIREPDRNGLLKGLKRFPDGIDLAHYDSDKSVQGRRFAYRHLWTALRPGGILISDDINDNLEFRRFATETAMDFYVFCLEEKFVGVLRR